MVGTLIMDFIYKSHTYRFLNKKYGVSRVESKNFKISKIEKLKTSSVCRLTFKKQVRKFYLSIPIDIKKKNTATKDVVALDPGVRSFLTYYDGHSVGEIGKNIHVKLRRLSKKMDRISAKRSKSKKSFQKLRLKKAMARIQEQITNIVKDLHYKACNFLKQYKVILLPKFNVKSMISGKNKYKISKQTRRSLLTLSHFKFKMRLIQKTSETGSRVIICNEACTNCGQLNNVGSKKDYSCSSCKLNIDRDVNGAAPLYRIHTAEVPKSVLE
jgi:putative transposase